MEIPVLIERTIDHLAITQATYNKFEPNGSYDKNKSAAAVTLYNRKLSVSEITKSLKISRSTLYEYLRREGVKE